MPFSDSEVYYCSFSECKSKYRLVRSINDIMGEHADHNPKIKTLEELK